MRSRYRPQMPYWLDGILSIYVILSLLLGAFTLLVSPVISVAVWGSMVIAIILLVVFDAWP